MWSNFHTHSQYCDGRSLPGETASAAVAKNVSCLGFSSHAPLPFRTKWAMQESRFDDYLAELTTLQENFPTLEIYRGLEVDFIPGRIGPGDFRKRLDYTIGSVHFTDTDDTGEYLEIDGPHNEFLRMLDSVYKGDIKTAITRYFELTEDMLRNDCPDVLGHPDKIKIQNTGNKFFSEDDSWYRKAVEQLVRTIKSSGVIVEVNTRGVYQKKCATTYPSPWILTLMQEERIPITLNSDAHHADDLINQFPETADLLLKTGFTHLMCLTSGKWQPLRFDQHGIKH